MSADPTWRNLVERAVATRLKTMIGAPPAPTYLITGGSGPYLTQPVLVTRSLTPDIREYDTEQLLGLGPVVGVCRRSGSTLAVDGQDTHGDEHRFSLVGYVKGQLLGAEDDIASDRLWNLWKDTVVCLFADPTLGGVCDDVDLDGEAETDESAIEPLAWFSQPWVATRPGFEGGL